MVLLVPPRDSAALAQAMLDLIHRPDKEIRAMADASLRAFGNYGIFVNDELVGYALLKKATGHPC